MLLAERSTTRNQKETPLRIMTLIIIIIMMIFVFIKQKRFFWSDILKVSAAAESTLSHALSRVLSSA